MSETKGGVEGAGKMEEGTGLKGLTGRAIAYGVVATALLCVAAVYLEIVMDAELAASATHVGVVAFFAAVLFFGNMATRGLANWCGTKSVCGRFFNALKLSGAELVVVYLMMLVASALTTLGLMENLIATMGGPAHYANDTNAWSQKVLPHVNPAMVPFDPAKMADVPSGVAAKEPETVKWLYDGMPQEKGFWDIPWGIWLRPLAVWMVLIFALFWSCYCLMAMLRRQWVERERLQFPLVQLPMAMVEGADAKRGISGFFRNRLMWLGFAVPMMLVTWNCLARSFPLLATIPYRWELQFMDKQLNFAAEPFNFPVIGFTYLVKTEVAFSLWAFCGIGIAVGSWMRWLGIQAGGSDMWSWRLHEHPWAMHAAFGGVVMLGLLTLWSARRSLMDVVKKATGTGEGVDDRNELMPYALAFWGFWGGLGVMLGWMTWIAGMTWWVAAVFLGVAFLGLLAATRMIAEGGLVFVQFPLAIPTVMLRTIGQTTLGAANLVGMSWMGAVWAGDIRVTMMPAIANSMKLGDAANLKRRRLFWAFALAVMVGVVVSGFMILWVGYTKGGNKSENWAFNNVARDYFASIAANNIPSAEQKEQGITAGDRMFASRKVAMAVGAGILVGLTVMRNWFLWWPLHPLGFPFSMMGAMQRIWVPVAMGWLFKVVILRYGGAVLFRKLRPFFLGLILGEYVTCGAWYVVYFLNVSFLHGAGMALYD